ncbi:MAG: 5-formyltetrahydrofolate cyclo-ligase [Bacillota bacterium]
MKDDIRRQMIENRNNMSSKSLKAQNDQIMSMIQSDSYFQKATYVGIYYPLKNEVNLLGLTQGNQKYAFPKVESDGIHFYLLDKKTSFKKSKFGIMEPQAGMNVDQQIDYLLVPALAIAKNHYRIGFGRGYYDRFLAVIRPTHVMGVIYDFQEIESFKTDKHDQQLDGYFKGSE